jgi:hypothetical protein
MEVVTIRMGTDQNLKPREFLRQFQGNFVGGFSGYFLLRGEGLYHVIVHPSPGLFVETFGVHELPVGGICHTVYSCYQVPLGYFVPGFVLLFTVLHGTM